MLLNAGIVSASVGGEPTLLNNLVAWYSMDESSGNALDAHTGGRNLTQNGTIGSVTGKVNGARSFSSTAHFFEATNTAFDLSSSDYSIAAWVNVSNFSDFRSLFNGLWGATDNLRAWRCFAHSSTGVVFFQVVNTSSTRTSVESSPALTSSTTMLIELRHNVAAKNIGVAINGGSFVEATYTGTIRSDNLFRIGSYDGTQQSLVGWVDEVALWNRILTTDERAELYNSGNGLGYPG